MPVFPEQNKNTSKERMFGGIPFSIFVFIAVVTASATAAPPGEPVARYERSEIKMGVPFTIILYAADAGTAEQALDAAFARIDDLNAKLSDYDAESELSRLCRQSPTNEPIAVSDDLWRVLHHAQGLSERTNGAFDVTVGPLTKLWRRARRRNERPSEEQLAAARAAVGFRFVTLDANRQTVSLARPNMQLDLGGIAKGYAADEAIRAIKKFGLTRVSVNASGDFTLADPPPGETGWQIGVLPHGEERKPLRMLRLANCGVAVSGDAFQFIEIEGRRHSHLLDPRTGWGVEHSTAAAVVAPSGMEADALASAVCVLGSEAGMELLEALRGIEGLSVLHAADDGALEARETKGFRELPAR